MDKKLQTHIKQIQAHINRNFKRWFKNYPHLEGVHVGLKEVKDKQLDNCYAIVFHVTVKKKKPKKMIPPYFWISTRGKKKIKVDSDVIETGKFILHGIQIGDQTKNSGSGLIGTISFYFTSSNAVYLGSNMHVLAPNLINKGITSYDLRNGDAPQQILLTDGTIKSTGQLVVARFNGIDFALAQLDDPQDPAIIERSIKEIGPVNGFFTIDESNYKFVSTSFYGISSHHQDCNITEIRAVKHVSPPGIYLTNLIKFSPCTEDGDSGAPVIDQNQNMVGVIIGKDKKGSYALHIDDVINFFQTSNL